MKIIREIEYHDYCSLSSKKMDIDFMFHQKKSQKKDKETKNECIHDPYKEIKMESNNVIHPDIKKDNNYFFRLLQVI